LRTGSHKASSFFDDKTGDGLHTPAHPCTILCLDFLKNKLFISLFVLLELHILEQTMTGLNAASEAGQLM
jgi:hypothetical protein